MPVRLHPSVLEDAAEEELQHDIRKAAFLGIVPVCADVVPVISLLPFGDQYIRSTQMINHRGHDQKLIVGRPRGKRALLFCLALIIKLSFKVVQNGLTVGRQIESLTQVSKRSAQPAQHLQVGHDSVADAGILHFDRDRPTIPQCRPVHLPQ